MKQLTNKQIELLNKNEGWITWDDEDGRPSLPKDSMIDYFASEKCVTGTGLNLNVNMDDNFCWEKDSAVIAYRLHVGIAVIRNPVTYKEAQAEQDATKYTQQDNGDWLEDKVSDPIRKYIIMEAIGSTHFSYPDGTISDVHIIDGMNNGVKYMLLDNKWVIDEQAGCKITEIKEQGAKEGAKLNWLMSFIEHDLDMQKIALEACLEHQKVIDKAKNKKAVVDRAMFDADVCDVNSRAEVKAMFEELYNLNQLTMPGECNE